VLLLIVVCIYDRVRPLTLNPNSDALSKFLGVGTATAPAPASLESMETLLEDSATDN